MLNSFCSLPVAEDPGALWASKIPNVVSVWYILRLGSREEVETEEIPFERRVFWWQGQSNTRK